MSSRESILSALVKPAVATLIAIAAVSGSVLGQSFAKPLQTIPVCTAGEKNGKVVVSNVNPQTIQAVLTDTLTCTNGTTQECDFCIVYGLIYDDPNLGWVYVGFPPKQGSYFVQCNNQLVATAVDSWVLLPAGTYRAIFTVYGTPCDAQFPHQLQNYLTQFTVT